MENDISKKMLTVYYRHYKNSLGTLMQPHKKRDKNFSSIVVTAMEDNMDVKKLAKFSAIEYYNSYIRPENFSLPRIKIKRRNIKNQTMKIRRLIDSDSSDEDSLHNEITNSVIKERNKKLLISETKCKIIKDDSPKLNLPKLFIAKNEPLKDKTEAKPKNNYTRKNYRGLNRSSSRSSIISHSSCIYLI